MAELLRTNGTHVHQKINVTELIDSQATASGIKRVLTELANLAGPDDAILFHVSAHGAMVGQRYYLIPHEFRSSGGQIQDDVRSQGLPADVIGDLLGRIPAKRRMVVFDTCASGGALRLNKHGGNPFDFRGALDRIGSDTGIFMIAAAGEDEEAQEVEDLKHGLLTYSLLAAAGAVEHGPLRDKAVMTSNPRQTIDVLEWFSFSSGVVPRLMQQYFGRAQEVRLTGSGTAFPVLRVSGY